MKKKPKVYILVERDILYRHGYFYFWIDHCNNYIRAQLQCHIAQMETEKSKNWILPKKLFLFRISLVCATNFLNEQLYYQAVPDILYRRAHLKHSF